MGNSTWPDHIGKTAGVWIMSGKYGSTSYNRGDGVLSDIVIISSDFVHGPTVRPTVSPTMPTMSPTAKTDEQSTMDTVFESTPTQYAAAMVKDTESGTDI